jgi:hypothetical protein
MTRFFVRRVLGISTGFPSKPLIGGAAAALICLPQWLGHSVKIGPEE